MSAASERTVSSYPPAEASKDQRAYGAQPLARIAAVDIDSPAYDAGFEAGCALATLDGEPILDILDWRWRSDGDEIVVGYIDNDGDTGTITLTRDCDEPWGFEFEESVFDRVHECRNACTFCFMRQLPSGMRSSLTLRDDDFRLSFLSGTFVTLTNLSEADEARIINQRISPLHVSLQAIEPEVRQSLIGKHEARGIEALEQLLDAGITCYCQIVLVPGENDGEHLRATLDWAYERSGIMGVGIVPLGYTSHQDRFTNSFEYPSQAVEVLELLKTYQDKALEERGAPWVYAADEFYLTAYGKQVLDLMPSASFYGGYEMFEDGIGMVRSTLDEWEQARESGLLAACGEVLTKSDSNVLMVSGFAQQAYLSLLMRDPSLGGRLQPLYVENLYFGGNVDVTGLLTGQDIVRTLQALEKTLTAGNNLVAIPSVIFNDDGMTLDDMTLEDIANQTVLPVRMVSCSTLDYLQEIIDFVE